MENTTEPNKQQKQKHSANILELLLALSILSVSMYPLVYIFRISQTPRQKTQTEYLATLLAHHVIETIVARKSIDPAFLPLMSDAEPVVQSADSVAPVSHYFKGICETGENITENDPAQLFWHLKQFNCQINTYYLEGDLYKVIVYISYQNEGRNMRVFFERLLPQRDSNKAEEDE
ncbi:MAG: hypothetical protein CVV41_13450 [Candidatus Riflebacteria bacterium HGW-Riflebacteria-1]|jgi:type II secretory pathway pseudopilin PulG|nr:MAG: hypothetical protein CVV41_13450 [Candidatus Riflebacteria bacterium HGW-Riflebacteria-1]